MVERGMLKSEIERMSMAELTWWARAYAALDVERKKHSKEK
jgi:hypothetical protein